eukprot:CAMPEP_0180138452 /NCGR_PEP_ID=MMETSP0986-20121125/12906_1 /TAXON_ID=697907 /ORGANISM="non described non described, Strain CCMP2293" /LENGTH=106 /DNA_ID=CAMNT_0022080287 /DNA_START=384 /DNA_END=704 /DNA_ORIENTATION=+
MIVSSPRLNETDAIDPCGPSSFEATTFSGARYTGTPSTEKRVSPVRSSCLVTASPHELPGTAVLKKTAPVASTPKTAPIPDEAALGSGALLTSTFRSLFTLHKSTH